MLDLLIRGGRVGTSTDEFDADIGIKDGQIVLLVAPDSIEIEASKTIEAKDRVVVPGGIDAHVHFSLALNETMRAQSSEAGSRAAAYGGTTTFIDFALQQGKQSLVESIEDKLNEVQSERPHIDYGLHAMVTGDFPFSVIDEVKEAVTGGVNSFKMFTTFSGDSASGSLFTDDGRIWGVMNAAEKAGGLAMIHAEDDCIIDYNVRRLYAEGRQRGENIHLARPNLAEEAAIKRMILLSHRSGCPLYVVHVSTHEGVQAIGEARSNGIPALGEALYQYLVFTHDAYEKPRGLTYHNYPPLKYEEDRLALWDAISDRGSLDTVASDDFTIPLEAKLAGQQVDNVSGGHNGIENRIGFLYSEGVANGKITLNDLVRVSATRPAQIFGLYPRKGDITLGSDADLVIIDPQHIETKSLENLHSECDYSIWDGWEFSGYPVTTISRGQVLVDRGEWVGPKGAGQFVPSSTPSI